MVPWRYGISRVELDILLVRLLVRYRVEHSKRNSISRRTHVSFCMYVKRVDHGQILTVRRLQRWRFERQAFPSEYRNCSSVWFMQRDGGAIKSLMEVVVRKHEESIDLCITISASRNIYTAFSRVTSDNFASATQPVHAT